MIKGFTMNKGLLAFITSIGLLHSASLSAQTQCVVASTDFETSTELCCPILTQDNKDGHNFCIWLRIRSLRPRPEGTPSFCRTWGIRIFAQMYRRTIGCGIVPFFNRLQIRIDSQEVVHVPFYKIVEFISNDRSIW